ncbi:ferric-chelate reductase 1-like [Saccostrea echinata]|uniref:ferric-chelate reductase 1-like n=1 Tax=Saccostrea echinata TaxID=191078 RepID=UPI002A831B71|nr:ferric-chelate reductase 1-like [Saccostrea echinata]
MCFVGLVLSFLLVKTSVGYPDGAPERACFFMIPRHTHPQSNRPIFKQMGGSPYNITVSSVTYTPNKPLRVTISGAPFKGFLIVAGEEGSKDWPTGQWYTENDAARPMFCSGNNDAITHSNSRWKDSITLLWYGPTHSTADMIQFIATVVTNRTTYWTEIRSPRITMDNAAQEAQAEFNPFTAAMSSFGSPGLDPWGYPTTDAWGWGGGFGGMSRGGRRSSSSGGEGAAAGEAAPAGEGATPSSRNRWGSSRMNFGRSNFFNPFSMFWRRRK